MERRFDIHVRATALLLFLAAVFFYGWNSDDAYHSYIMARHLVEGKGLVYNTGFRATASTCPLLTLFESFVFLFTDSADICGLFIGLLFSGAAAWVLFFRICPTLTSVFCALGLLVTSRCFLSFTTSGLENPMLFFFGAVFFDVYFRTMMLGRGSLFVLSLLMSVLAMARADSVLIFIPMAVWAFLVRTKVPFCTRMAIGVAGLLPFALWTCFSLIYYGFPFPNTYYAKLYTGIPLADYVTSGLWYFQNSIWLDPMLLLVPALAVVLAVKESCRRLIPLFMGLLAYCIYIVLVGGDFMAGRHITQQFFLSLCAAMFVIGGLRSADGKSSNISTGLSPRHPLAIIMLVIAAIGFLWDGFMAPRINGAWMCRNVAWSLDQPAMDERQVYLSLLGERPLYKAAWQHIKGGNDVSRRNQIQSFYIRSAHERGQKGVCFGGLCLQYNVLWGRDVFSTSDLDMYLTDVFALQDPLLARLKVDTSHHWRVGHAAREIPRGYQETVATGENRIEDPALREYYEKLLLVMKAPLFDYERLRTIWDLNRGKYEHLLACYEQKRYTTNDLELAFREINVGKNADRALELLDRCSKAENVYPAAVVHYGRGCVYEDLKGDPILAESEYESALRGNWGVALVPCADRLARLKACSGKLDEAIALWEKAMKVDPGNDAIGWNLNAARQNAASAKGTNPQSK